MFSGINTYVLVLSGNTCNVRPANFERCLQTNLTRDRHSRTQRRRKRLAKQPVFQMCQETPIFLQIPEVLWEAVEYDDTQRARRWRSLGSRNEKYVFAYATCLVQITGHQNSPSWRTARNKDNTDPQKAKTGKEKSDLRWCDTKICVWNEILAYRTTGTT